MNVCLSAAARKSWENARSHGRCCLVFFTQHDVKSAEREYAAQSVERGNDPGTTAFSLPLTLGQELVVDRIRLIFEHQPGFLTKCETIVLVERMNTSIYSRWRVAR